MKSKKLSLLFYTWNTDTLGIFDYQNAMVSTSNNNTENEDCYYYQSGYYNYIEMHESHSELTKNDFLLFRTRKDRNNNYEIINALKKNMKNTKENINRLDSKLWFVIKPEIEGKFENNNKSYILNENDIIKFGRKKYQVIKLNSTIKPILEKDSLSSINNRYGQIFDISLKKNQFCNKIITKLESETIFNNSKSNSEEKKKSINLSESNDTIKSNQSKSGKATFNDGYNPEQDCRVCFSSISTKENPKLKMCNCHTYIHYNCLKMFLKTNIKVSENLYNNVTSYKSEKFNCEVCEEPYPLKFKIKFDDNEIREYCLLDGLMLPDDTNYLILESLTYVKEKKNLKNIFVIKLTNDEITFGRNEKNDMVDCDITISRFHAKIKYNENSGEVNIISTGKYGVLVLVKDNLKMEDDEKIYLQVGKTFARIEQKEINDEGKSGEND